MEKLRCKTKPCFTSFKTTKKMFILIFIFGTETLKLGFFYNSDMLFHVAAFICLNKELSFLFREVLSVNALRT